MYELVNYRKISGGIQLELRSCGTEDESKKNIKITLEEIEEKTFIKILKSLFLFRCTYNRRLPHGRGYTQCTNHKEYLIEGKNKFVIRLIEYRLDDDNNYLSKKIFIINTFRIIKHLFSIPFPPIELIPKNGVLYYSNLDDEKDFYNYIYNGNIMDVVMCGEYVVNAKIPHKVWSSTLSCEHFLLELNEKR